MWLVAHSGLQLRPESHFSATLVMFRLRSIHLAKYRYGFKLFTGSEGLGLQGISGQREKRHVLHMAAACTLIVFMDR
jgi:hypothetical protein